MAITAAAASGIGGAIGGGGGGLLGMGASALAAHQAWGYQKKILKNQIKWRVNDLRQAGINPLLAVGGGLGGGASGPGVTPAKFDLTSGMRAGSEYSLRAKQEDVAVSAADSNRAEAELKRAQAAESAARRTAIEAGLPRLQTEETLWQKVLEGVSGGMNEYEKLRDMYREYQRNRTGGEPPANPKWNDPLDGLSGEKWRERQKKEKKR